MTEWFLNSVDGNILCPGTQNNRAFIKRLYVAKDDLVLLSPVTQSNRPLIKRLYVAKDDLVLPSAIQTGWKVEHPCFESSLDGRIPPTTSVLCKCLL